MALVKVKRFKSGFPLPKNARLLAGDFWVTKHPKWGFSRFVSVYHENWQEDNLTISI